MEEQIDYYKQTLQQSTEQDQHDKKPDSIKKRSQSVNHKGQRKFDRYENQVNNYLEGEDGQAGEEE